jgi:hypothetical protein
MQRVSECELVVFCGAAARRRRAAAKTALFIQKVFDCKWYKVKIRGVPPPPKEGQQKHPSPSSEKSKPLLPTPLSLLLLVESLFPGQLVLFGFGNVRAKIGDI